MFINNSLVSCWGHREQGGNGPRSYHVLGMVSDLWPWEVSQHSAFLIVTHPLPLESGGGGAGWTRYQGWSLGGGGGPDQTAKRAGT